MFRIILTKNSDSRMEPLILDEKIFSWDRVFQLLKEHNDTYTAGFAYDFRVSVDAPVLIAKRQLASRNWEAKYYSSR